MNILRPKSVGSDLQIDFNVDSEGKEREESSGHHEVLKRGGEIKGEVETVHEALRKSKKVNKQV